MKWPDEIITRIGAIIMRDAARKWLRESEAEGVARTILDAIADDVTLRPRPQPVIPPIPGQLDIISELQTDGR